MRILLSALVVSMMVFTACKREDDFVEPEAFSFVVYPGARYLGQLTETFKKGHKTAFPTNEPPPMAVYDTDAPIEQVAEFYAKEYAYGEVAPDVTNNLSASKPKAYYRTGELGSDAKAIEELLKKMNMPTDVSKAAGVYRAAEITPRPNRPRVTIQRPYFDPNTSAVVDRTLILMAR
jgi:hypothetical protein